MNEAETIDACILPALKAAGWGADGRRIRREHQFTEGRIESHGQRDNGRSFRWDEQPLLD